VTEVIKYLSGISELLTSRLSLFDGLGLKVTEMKVKKAPQCSECQHSDS